MTRRIALLGGGAILSTGIIVLGTTVLWSTPEVQPRTITAERRDIIQDVTFTGRLEATHSVDVAFELTGLLDKLFVTVGDTVNLGQELAQLDTRIARLEATQKAADVASGQTTARITWQNALSEVETTKQTNATTVEKARQTVRNAKAELDQARKVHAATDTESGSDSSLTKTAHAALLTKQSAYAAAQRTLEESLQVAKQTEDAASDQAALAQAQYLATTQTGPSIVGLSSLEASKEIKDVLLTKSTLLAPITGVVTDTAIESGEIAVANSPIITLQTTDNLEIRAQVPEIDASKLTVGMPATITLDVFTTAQQWPAKVVSVAPAAKIIDGVPTYEVILILSEQPKETIKPGLTANVTVHAASANNVVAVPRRAIITQDGNQFVRILEATGTTREQTVTTGLIGSDGAVEIVSGLFGDEEIIVSSTGE